MPSVDHQLLVELFRNGGELAPALLHACAGIALPHHHVEVASIDLSQVVSTEYRADLVVELRDADNATLAAVIVEIQLGHDPRKQQTWPHYLTGLRARLERPVYLLVFTTEPAIARWAQRAIEIGHPGFVLAPVVIQLEELPRDPDPRRVQRLPELGVLTAMAHPELEIAAAAIDATGPLPSDRKKLYLDVILSKLPEALRRIMEARMEGYRYQSDYARKYYAQGHDEGREEGRADALREAALKLVRSKLGGLAPDDQAAILALGAAPALTELVDALILAPGPAEVRAAVQRARAAARTVSRPREP